MGCCLQDVATHTRVKPEQRVGEMVNLVRALQNNAEAFDVLKSWGLQIDLDPVLVNKTK